jgi:hypothetical protein
MLQLVDIDYGIFFIERPLIDFILMSLKGLCKMGENKLPRFDVLFVLFVLSLHKNIMITSLTHCMTIHVIRVLV